MAQTVAWPVPVREPSDAPQMEALALVFIVIGALCQLSGFSVALFQSTRARRDQLPGTPSLYAIGHQRLKEHALRMQERAYVGIRTLLAKVGIKWTRQVRATLDARVGARATLTGMVLRTGQPLEQRVRLLEEDHQRVQAALEGRIEEAVSETEKRRRDEQRSSIHLEEAGTFAFLVGLIFTTAGAILAIA
jgi:hypothetical protein